MKSIKILTGLALLCLSGNVMAQNETDALRYSRLGIGGTARVQGMGGSQVAIGADAGNLAGNPAGLGLYRRSEFTFTPGLSNGNTSSQVDNNTSVDQRNGLNLSGLGLVFTRRKSDGTEGDWRNGSFGIGFTRQNTFQNKFNYNRLTGPTESTIVESIVENADAFGLSPNNDLATLEDLAYETYLINQDDDGYYGIERKGQIQQSEDILSQGAQNQWDFAYGASYRDKLYLGGAIGFNTLRYTQERNFSEVETDASTYFQSLDLRDVFTTTGNGINARVGFIYKPYDFIRFGGSIQSPTYFSMRDEYQTSLNVQEYESHQEATDPGEYTYNLTTPLRANGGVAFFLEKYGFISGDVEFVNYSKARLNDPTDSDVFRSTNNRISTAYNSTVNVKIGAEGRYEIFRVRAGYAHYGDPYKNSDYDRQQSVITAGAGIRQANYFLDVALVNTDYNSIYSPYVLNDGTQPVINTRNRYNNVLFTVGFNF